MYDVEKRSAVLENAAGFATRRVYIRSRDTKAALGYAYTANFVFPQTL